MTGSHISSVFFNHTCLNVHGNVDGHKLPHEALRLVIGVVGSIEMVFLGQVKDRNSFDLIFGGKTMLAMMHQWKMYRK